MMRDSSDNGPLSILCVHILDLRLDEYLQKMFIFLDW